MPNNVFKAKPRYNLDEGIETQLADLQRRINTAQAQVEVLKAEYHAVLTTQATQIAAEVFNVRLKDFRQMSSALSRMLTEPRRGCDLERFEQFYVREIYARAVDIHVMIESEDHGSIIGAIPIEIVAACALLEKESRHD